MTIEQQPKALQPGEVHRTCNSPECRHYNGFTYERGIAPHTVKRKGSVTYYKCTQCGGTERKQGTDVDVTLFKMALVLVYVALFSICGSGLLYLVVR